MKVQLQINKVEDVMEWLHTSAETYTASQSISWLIDQVGQLCGEMAFVNNQMTVAKKEFNKAKAAAYHTLILSSHANNQYFSPMLAKDYVGSRCEMEQYNYDICERASRTITHTLEALRTCISALKEESKIANYQGQV
ncbi:MAG: hypothetical protein H0X41_03145 [Chitinophagaceae bacterium]|nr:hypothetical protein [Chitinophagaceae bacterium]